MNDLPSISALELVFQIIVFSFCAIYLLTPIIVVVQLSAIHKQVKKGREELRNYHNALIQWRKAPPRPARVVRGSGAPE